MSEGNGKIIIPQEAQEQVKPLLAVVEREGHFQLIINSNDPVKCYIACIKLTAAVNKHFEELSRKAREASIVQAPASVLDKLRQ